MDVNTYFNDHSLTVENVKVLKLHKQDKLGEQKRLREERGQEAVYLATNYACDRTQQRTTLTKTAVCCSERQLSKQLSNFIKSAF